MSHSYRFLRLLIVVVLSMGSATPLLAGEFDDLRRKLGRAVQQKDTAVARDAIRDLGRSDHAEAADAILRVLPFLPDAEVADVVLAALRRLGEERLNASVESLLGKKQPDLLVVGTVFIVAEDWRGSISEKWLFDGLRHRDQAVQGKAVSGLRKRRSKAAVPLLIDELRELQGERSQLAYAVRQALIAITGHDFEAIEDWDSWWKVNGASFDPNKVEEGATGVIRRKPDPDRDVPRFFGVEIVSRKVLFLIDTSGSMRAFDPLQEEAGGTGSDWRIRQRIYRARTQLAAAVQKLPGDARFNIISYDDKFQVFSSKGLVPASKKWKKRATNFAEGLKAGGQTHTDVAFDQAFSDRNVDTIILLTDGAPYHSKEVGSRILIPQIIEQVRKLNKLRRLKIYTLGFEGRGIYPPGDERAGQSTGGGTRMVEFLKQLAKEHRGQYAPIR
ncbi:MAG: VWA domain-containing protein [Planctomycetota bacterium]